MRNITISIALIGVIASMQTAVFADMPTVTMPILVPSSVPVLWQMPAPMVFSVMDQPSQVFAPTPVQSLLTTNPTPPVDTTPMIPTSIHDGDYGVSPDMNPFQCIMTKWLFQYAGRMPLSVYQGYLSNLSTACMADVVSQGIDTLLAPTEDPALVQ